MALPSLIKHLEALEDAGLVKSAKEGRVRTYELVPKKFATAERWLSDQRTLWETRLDRLDAYLHTLEAEEQQRSKRRS